jgi:hypothetical protein
MTETKPTGCICFGEFPVINCPVHGIRGGGPVQDYVDGLRDATQDISKPLLDQIRKLQAERRDLKQEVLNMHRLIWILVNRAGGCVDLDLIGSPINPILRYSTSRTEPAILTITAKEK